jgi:hypothetical protein
MRAVSQKPIRLALRTACVDLCAFSTGTAGEEATNDETKNTICLWFDKDEQEAAHFYAAPFPDSEVTGVHRAPGRLSGWPGRRHPHGRVHRHGNFNVLASTAAGCFTIAKRSSS